MENKTLAANLQFSSNTMRQALVLLTGELISDEELNEKMAS
jgi:hypothetical protein